MAITLPSEAVCDIAAMAAILPAMIPIGGEILPTIGADESVDCLFLYAVQVAVPPGCPAGIRAENSGLAFGKDFRGLAAVLAKDSILWGTAIQTIAAAKGSDGIIGKAKQLADFEIAIALQTKGLDLFFFMVCHGMASSRDSSSH
jgi:hypothetical protein